MKSKAASDQTITTRRAGLILSFGEGERPDCGRIADALAAIPRATISFDPSLAAPAHPVSEPPAASAGAGQAAARAATDGLELLMDGLSFDLVGLAPGASLAPPAIAHHFHSDVEADAVHAHLGLFPGTHIVHGLHLPPILRALLELGAGLVESLPNIARVSWTPARSAIAPAFFIRTVRAWLEGGPFPALGLAGFAFTDDRALHSEGLRWLIGGELAIDPALATDGAAALRLAARLAHELVGARRLTGEIYRYTEDGLRLRLAYEPAEALIRVTPG